MAFAEQSCTNDSWQVHKYALSPSSSMCQSPFFLSLMVMLFYWANLFSVSSFSQSLKYSLPPTGCLGQCFSKENRFLFTSSILCIFIYIRTFKNISWIPKSYKGVCCYHVPVVRAMAYLAFMKPDFAHLKI